MQYSSLVGAICFSFCNCQLIFQLITKGFDEAAIY